MYNNILRIVKSIIESEVGIDAKEIKEDEELLEGRIMLDSLTVLRLVVAIEDTFNITFDDDDINDETFRTIRCLVDTVTKYLPVSEQNMFS